MGLLPSPRFDLTPLRHRAMVLTFSLETAGVVNATSTVDRQLAGEIIRSQVHTGNFGSPSLTRDRELLHVKVRTAMTRDGNDQVSVSGCGLVHHPKLEEGNGLTGVLVNSTIIPSPLTTS